MQSLPGEALVIQTTGFNSRVHLTQESICLVAETSEAQTLLIVAVTLMLLVLKDPGQNQKPSKRGCSELQEQHTNVLTVTKQKSECFAPSYPQIHLSALVAALCQGSSVYALIHQMGEVKSDQ